METQRHRGTEKTDFSPQRRRDAERKGKREEILGNEVLS